MDLRRQEFKKNKEEKLNNSTEKDDEIKDDEQENDNENNEPDFNYCSKEGEKRLFLPTSQCTVNNIFDCLVDIL